jgi:hypothetical protein
MKMNEIKLDWISRLGKVLFIFISLVAIPICFIAGGEVSYSSAMSNTLLYSAYYLFATYGILITLTKTLLYIKRGENFLKVGFRKKHYVLLSLPIICFLAGSLIFLTIVEPMQRANEMKQAEIQKKRVENDYHEALAKIDGLKLQLQECLNPVIEKKASEGMRSCNLLKGKIKNDYDFCVSLTSINSPTSCLYDNDYQSIDCSKETIRKNAASRITKGDLSFTCQLTMSEIDNANKAIEKYNPFIGL